MAIGTSPLVWHRPSIGALDGGRQLEEWLLKITREDINLLFICGAGLSMPGVPPTPSGPWMAQVFFNYLDHAGISIPLGWRDSIDKLYQYYCYDLSNPPPAFNSLRHREFARAMTNPGAGFYFLGSPNDSHFALEREVAGGNGRVRVFSVNVDAFFQIAPIMQNGLALECTRVINASDLISSSTSCNSFRDWGILAAHGRIDSGTSVWSTDVISKHLADIDTLYAEEKEVIHAAIKCIQNGPTYKYILFVGVCAPLVYLADSLLDKVEDSFEWAWINPYDAPQDWLLSYPSFSETNGTWIQADCSSTLYSAHFNRYSKWYTHSCNEAPLRIIDEHNNEIRQKQLVESTHRSRRIFIKGASALSKARSDASMLDALNVFTKACTPPAISLGYEYNDKSLAFIINKLYEQGVKITSLPGDNFPKCSIAVKRNDDLTSVQIVQYVSESIDDIAEGIVYTIEICEDLDSDLLHIVIIDAIDLIVNELSMRVNDILIRRFAFRKPNVIIKRCQDMVSGFPDLNSFRGRPIRP